MTIESIMSAISSFFDAIRRSSCFGRRSTTSIHNDSKYLNILCHSQFYVLPVAAIDF